MSEKKNNVRILLVEDEVITAMQMKADLERCGFTVLDFVTTGEEAVSCASREKPELILMDINLAGRLDGIDAASRIREQYPVTIIFLTGYDDSGLKLRAETVRPLQYLIKPVRTAVIAGIIETWLETASGREI